MTIHATITGGRLEIIVPADWPDGTVVEVRPLARSSKDDGLLTPEEIRQTLAAMEQVQPLEMSEVELRSWEIERENRREREKEQFANHLEKLREAWE